METNVNRDENVFHSFLINNFAVTSGEYMFADQNRGTIILCDSIIPTPSGSS